MHQPKLARNFKLKPCTSASVQFIKMHFPFNKFTVNYLWIFYSGFRYSQEIQSNKSEGLAKPDADKSKEYLSSTTATFLYTPNLTGQVDTLQADNEFLCVWTVLCPLRKSLHSGVALGGKKEREWEMCHHTRSVCNACKYSLCLCAVTNNNVMSQ